jgi:hypothetical protein
VAGAAVALHAQPAMNQDRSREQYWLCNGGPKVGGRLQVQNVNSAVGLTENRVGCMMDAGLQTQVTCALRDPGTSQAMFSVEHTVC